MLLQKISKPLKIGHTRTCDCPPKHINCLSAKEWMQSQIAVWEFYYEKRDSRNAVGFDLKEEYVDYANARVSYSKDGTSQLAINDEAKKIPEYFDNETVSLCVTSPPYANLLNRKRKNKSKRGNLREDEHFLKVQQYSEDSRDLGTMDVEEYSDTLGDIFGGILPILKPRGHCVINITDYWWKGKRVPIHIHVIDALQKVGYELRNTIIWDRRNIVNKVGIFGWPSNYITLTTTFEYLLHFWKPE
jgi:DNA modification methylase